MSQFKQFNGYLQTSFLGEAFRRFAEGLQNVSGSCVLFPSMASQVPKLENCIIGDPEHLFYFP